MQRACCATLEGRGGETLLAGRCLTLHATVSEKHEANAREECRGARNATVPGPSNFHERFDKSWRTRHGRGGGGGAVY